MAVGSMVAAAKNAASSIGGKAVIIGAVAALAVAVPVAGVVGTTGLMVGGIVVAGGQGVSSVVGGGDGGGLTGTPEEYTALILKAGKVCKDITPALIAAQIQQESGFRAIVSSSAGASGISQFLPSTWAAVGKDGDGDGKADINNPADAIWTQAHYMCDQLANIRAYKKKGVALSGNDVDLALAAYNAGLGSVLKFKGIPPFQETQGYVRNIRANIAKFSKASLGPDPAASFVSASSLGPGDIGRPITGPLRINSPFGYRVHPVTGERKHHNGVDLQATTGVPQYAGIDGTVIFAGWNSTCGNMVQVQGKVRSDTVMLQYCHLSAISVRQGQGLKKGQQIGLTGATGRVTGPHVHFEVHLNGSLINPMSLPGFQ